MRRKFGVSERLVCRALQQHRSAHRYVLKSSDDEDRLVHDMIELARQHGRYGYRRIAAMLRDLGWQLNDKQVARLWRREGLKVPMKQPKRSRLWLNDRSCIRLRPQHVDHVWSYDFSSIGRKMVAGIYRASRSGNGSRPSAQWPLISSLGHPGENGYCESFNARFRD